MTIAVLDARTGPIAILALGENTAEAARWSVVSQGYADAAALSASTAEAASGPTYASTALGLAATTSGEAFAVDAGGGLVSVYLNSAGSAVFQRTLATNAALAAPGGAALVGKSGGGTVQGYLTSNDTLLTSRMIANPTAGNLVIGSTNSGKLLNATTSGSKNGDISTAFGINTLVSATSAYALSAFGYGALNKVTTGHSNTGLGYQAGHNLTTGERNTLVGVDAMFLAQSASFNVVVGHHCMNSGVYTGQGSVVIGQQTARSLTTGDYIIAIGRNAMANSPATGSQNSVVIGGIAATLASVDASVIIGHQAVAMSGAITGSVIIGRGCQYGGGTVNNTVQIGRDSMFQATGGGGDNNATVGYQTGFNLAGTGNVLFGYRAGWHWAPTTVNSAVCIGNLAGFGMVTSGDLYIGNSTVLAAHLIWGNFGTQVLNLRSNSLKLVDLPTFADDAAAGAGNLLSGVVYKTATGELRIKI